MGSLPATSRANLAEELKLCAIARHGYSTSPRLVPGLGGALALELVLAERIEIEGDSIFVLDPTPTGDELVDDLLAGLGDSDSGLVHLSIWIAGVGVGASPHVHHSLIAKGLVSAEGEAFDHYRISGAGLEPCRRAGAVLSGDREPDTRTAVLVGLASVCGLVEALVPAAARELALVRAVDLITGDLMPGRIREAVESTLAATAEAALSTQRATQAA
jgi:hypothetical protein